MLISVRGRNMDGMRGAMEQSMRSALCRSPGIKINPEDILFQFGQPQIHRVGDEERTIKVMIVLDPFPGLEEIDNIDSETIKLAVKLAAEKVTGNREVTVSLRCARSCVGDYCWD